MKHAPLVISPKYVALCHKIIYLINVILTKFTCSCHVTFGRQDKLFQLSAVIWPSVIVILLLENHVVKSIRHVYPISFIETLNGKQVSLFFSKHYEKCNIHSRLNVNFFNTSFF